MPAPRGFSAEPPQGHPAVALALTLAHRLHRAPLVTPHMFGGTTTRRMQYEYDGAPAFLAEVARYLSPTWLDDRIVLDLGCGWGGKAVYYGRHTKARRIVAIDLPGYDAAGAHDFARAHRVTSCAFDVGDAEALPYRGDVFDVVLSEDVMEHVGNPAAVLAEAYRVLKPGGVFVAIFPSFLQANAHHLDRAINLPALHYLLSMKTWASGLNRVRETDPTRAYSPFGRVVRTPFRQVTCDLNGMSFRQFSELVGKTSFEPEVLRLVPRQYGRDRWLVGGLYRLALRVPALREFLADHVLFIGRKPVTNCTAEG
jgi:SAM-dependent methyltransferase